MTDVWLFVFAVPWLVMLIVGPRLERRLRRRRTRAVDFDGGQRRAAERYPRCAP